MNHIQALTITATISICALISYGLGVEDQRDGNRRGLKALLIILGLVLIFLMVPTIK